MSAGPAEKSTTPGRRPVCALLLAPRACRAASRAPVHAQDTELRGAVSRIRDPVRPAARHGSSPLPPRPQAADAARRAPPRTYVPVSPGAVPDDTTLTPRPPPAAFSIQPHATDDAAADEPTPPSPAPPSTTAQTAADQAAKAGTEAADKSKCNIDGCSHRYRRFNDRATTDADDDRHGEEPAERRDADGRQRRQAAD